MRIPRVYLDQACSPGQTLTLPEAQSHYLGKVLRLEPGRALLLFNNTGWEYRAQVVVADKKSLQVAIEDGTHVDRESPLTTHLAIGISRGDRMDWVLQKATELGVTGITPLFSERTEVRLSGERLAKKMAHWQQILISACEQCQRNRLPELKPATELTQFLSQQNTDLKLVLHHRAAQAISQLPQSQSVTLLIGPEGGLSEAEIALAIDRCGYQALSLGPRVLRTETAPLAALTALQLKWGDLG